MCATILSSVFLKYFDNLFVFIIIIITNVNVAFVPGTILNTSHYLILFSNNTVN